MKKKIKIDQGRLTDLQNRLGKAPVDKLFIYLLKLVQRNENLPIINNIITNSGFNFKDSISEAGNTLLNEASAHGSDKIISFLLKEGFNPNKCDAHQKTPLIRAAEFGRVEAFKTLLGKTKNIDAQDDQGLSALLYAVMRKNSKIEKLLIKHQANKTEEIKCFGAQYNYNSFKQFIVSKKFHIKLGFPNVCDLETQLFSIGVICYYAACNSTKNQEWFVSTAIDNFIKIVKNESKNGTTYYINESLSSLADLFFTLSSRDKFLEKFIIQNATQLKNNKALLSIYIALILNAMDIGDNAEALKYITLAEALNSGHQVISNEEKANILYNLGISTGKVDSLNALEYLTLARKLDPRDDRILREIFNIYTRTENFELAGKFACEINDEVLRDLLLINLCIRINRFPLGLDKMLQSFSFSRFNVEKLREESNDKFTLYLDILSSIYNIKGNVDGAVEVYQKHLKGENLQDFYIKVLDIYYLRGLWHKGFSFMKEIYNSEEGKQLRYITDVSVKYLECIFYLNNDCIMEAMKSLKFIQKTAKKGSFALSLAVSATENLLPQLLILGKYAETKDFLDFIALHDSNHKSVVEHYKKLIEVLELSEKEKLQEEKEKTSLKTPQKLQEVKPISNLEEVSINSSIKSKENTQKSNIVTIDLTAWIDSENEQEIYSKFTPKQIHNYFQTKKAEAKKIKITEGVNNSFYKKTCWQTTHGDKYYEDNVFAIPNKPNYYAAFSSKICKKFHESQMLIFYETLKKGFVKKAHSQNGLKYVDGIIELKTSKDVQLYATIIYIQDGKQLIFFNKFDNHNIISKVATTPLDIIDCSLFGTIKSELYPQHYYNYEGNNEPNLLGDDVF